MATTTGFMVIGMQFTLLLLLLCISNASSFNNIPGDVQTNEVKSPNSVSLCGETFVMAWKYICKFKEHQQNSVERRRAKRSIKNFLKPRRKDFVPKQGALSFLKSRNRRQILLGGTDNADEECCKESCSYGEIAEYEC